MVDYEAKNYHFKNPRNDLDEGLKYIKSFQCELNNEEWKGNVFENDPYQFNLSHEGWGIDTIKTVREIGGIRRLFNYIISHGGNVMVQYEIPYRGKTVKQEIYFS